MENQQQDLQLNVELEHDLRDGDDYNVLVIKDPNHHHLAFNKLGTDQRHRITWTLTGNASGGEFCRLDDPLNPGFVWLVTKPNDTIFRKLDRGRPDLIQVDNHHNDKSSEGRWHYQLFARFGDRVYGVPLTFTSGAASNPNPSIKNN